MFADDLAFGIDKIPPFDLFFQFGYAPFEKPPVIVVGHKTDFVTLRFFRQLGIPSIKSNLPDFRFSEFAHRKLGTLECFLAQAPQHVRLVFMGVSTFADEFTAIQILDLGIMTSGNELTIQRVGAFQQGIPLDVSIAEHTRVRRTASNVFFYKIIDDKIAKFIPDVDDEMVKPHAHRNFAGIVDGVQAATARFFFGTSRIGIIPGFHGDANHFISFFMEQHGSNGTVDATTHGH